MLQRSMAVALGGRAVGSHRFGGGTLAPEALSGALSQTFSLPDRLGRAFGPGSFFNTPDVLRVGEKASLKASLGHTLAGWSTGSCDVTRQPAKQMVKASFCIVSRCGQSPKDTIMIVKVILCDVTSMFLLSHFHDFSISEEA
jgi:hypothetical protein